MTRRVERTLVHFWHDCKTDEAGFTVLELMVVITILGAILAVAAPTLFNTLKAAKAALVKQDIEAMDSIIDTYRLEIGSVPTQEQGLKALTSRPSDVVGWAGPYVRNVSALMDPWGRPWIYSVPSRRENHDYDLCSAGPDGKGTSPDEGESVCNP